MFCSSLEGGGERLLIREVHFSVVTVFTLLFCFENSGLGFKMKLKTALKIYNSFHLPLFLN